MPTAILSKTKSSHALTIFLELYHNIFNEPKGLPLQRPHNHSIPLKDCAQPINMRPYKYLGLQKNIVKKMIL